MEYWGILEEYNIIPEVFQSIPDVFVSIAYYSQVFLSIP